jgi:hypothetical protein
MNVELAYAQLGAVREPPLQRYGLCFNCCRDK